MTRNQHRNLFNTILKKQEERSVSAVYMALRKQYIRTINNIKREGIGWAIQSTSFELFNKEMHKAVERIYLQAGLFMANRTLSNLKKISGVQMDAMQRSKGADKSSSPLSKKVNSPLDSISGLERGTVLADGSTSLRFKYATFGFNEEWINQILNYFSRYLLEKATVGVTETTKEKILNILNKAIQEGWSNDQTVKELSQLEEIRRRARMIARTETVRAANYGVLLGAGKYEYETEKEWIAVLDNRVRHSHANVDGQKRENDDPFGNGLQFPGDPNAPASEVCNCRCSLAMIAKRDSRGRLIPKINKVAA